MTSCIVFVAILQALVLQIAYTQCVNRVVPSCGQLPLETYLPLDGLLPNQLLLSQAGPLALPALQNYAQYPIVPSLAAAEPVTYAPTVIQDSSVANSLANALQLLVVSNLLSTTLPGACDPGYFVDPYLPFGAVGPIGPVGPVAPVVTPVGPIGPVGPFSYIY